MAVKQRQVFIQEPTPKIQQPQQPKKKKRSLITTKEKFLYVGLVLCAAYLSVSILHKQGELQSMTIAVQQTEAQVNEITRENVDLKVQVSELSKYDRIWEKAQALGFTLNKDNVKVVPGND